jgi:hypothetical protein
MELYCAAHGLHSDPLTTFRDPDVEFEIEQPIEMKGPLGHVYSLPQLATPDPSQRLNAAGMDPVEDS